MTHAELTRDDRQGFASRCPGELTEAGTYEDRTATAAGVAVRSVTVYRCECGRVISAAAGGPVLNSYVPLSR